MTPNDQQPEHSDGYLQTTLFGEPEWVPAKPKRKQRRNSTSTPPGPESTPAAAPSVRPWWKRAMRGLERMVLGLWQAARWVFRHKSEFKTAWWFVKWIVGLAAAGGAGRWGITQLQGEVAGYRWKVNKAPPDTGWDGELRVEPKPAKKKPPEVPK